MMNKTYFFNSVSILYILVYFSILKWSILGYSYIKKCNHNIENSKHVNVQSRKIKPFMLLLIPIMCRMKYDGETRPL